MFRLTVALALLALATPRASWATSFTLNDCLNINALSDTPKLCQIMEVNGFSHGVDGDVGASFDPLHNLVAGANDAGGALATSSVGYGELHGLVQADGGTKYPPSSSGDISAIGAAAQLGFRDRIQVGSSIHGVQLSNA